MAAVESSSSLCQCRGQSCLHSGESSSSTSTVLTFNQTSSHPDSCPTRRYCQQLVNLPCHYCIARTLQTKPSSLVQVVFGPQHAPFQPKHELPGLCLSGARTIAERSLQGKLTSEPVLGTLLQDQGPKSEQLEVEAPFKRHPILGGPCTRLASACNLALAAGQQTSRDGMRR